MSIFVQNLYLLIDSCPFSLEYAPVSTLNLNYSENLCKQKASFVTNPLDVHLSLHCYFMILGYHGRNVLITKLGSASRQSLSFGATAACKP